MRDVNRFPAIIAELQARTREAELAGAELIVASAKDRVPVDPDSEHHLRDAIHAKEDEDGVWVIAGDSKRWYGHMVEHGTTHSPPHPFLVPALEENREAVIGLVRGAISKSVQ